MENPYFQYRESGQENLKCQNSFSICFFPLLLESHATFCLPSLSPISLRWTAEKEFNFVLSRFGLQITTMMSRVNGKTGTLVRWASISMACGVDEIRIHKWPIQPLEYAPWGDARPYDGGFRYNCMMLKVRFPSHAWHWEWVAAQLFIFSWRSRIPGVSGQKALVSVSMMIHARWMLIRFKAPP